LKSRILIVEDESIEAISFEQTLKSFGYDVIGIASTGEDSLQKVADLKPDLILMDIVLKGEMDGIEAAAKIKEDFDIPVVYLTAHPEESAVNRAKLTSPYGYLIKPVNKTDLKNTIELALYKHEMDKTVLASQERFFSIVEGMVDGMIISYQGIIDYVNPSMAQLLRADSVEELLGKSFFDFLTPSSQQMAIQEMQRKQEGKEFTENVKEYELKPIKGSTITCEVKLSSIQLEGKIYGVSTYHNITPTKKAEKNLKEGEAKYRSIFEKSMDAVLLAAPNGDILEANPAAENLFGYSREEICKLGRMGIVDADDTRLPEFLKERQLSDKAKTELRFIKKDGSKFTAEITSAVFKDIDGNKLTSTIIRDITEREKLEEALERSESLYRTIFENTGAATLIFDKEGIISMINSEMENLSGFSREELERRMNWMEFVHPDELPMMLQYHQQRQKDPDSVPSQYETRFINRKGDVLDVLITVDKLPEVEEYITSMVNITERKQSEILLEQMASVVRYSSELVNLAELGGRMFFLNDAGSRILGIPPEEVEKYLIYDVIPEAYQNMVKTEVLPSILEEGSWEGDLQYFNLQTGKLTDVHAMTFQIKDPSTGKPLYLANVSLDITQRREAEKALRDSGEMLKAVIFGSPIPTFVIDKNHEVTYWNNALDKQSGIKASEVIGTNHHWKAFYSNERPCMADLLLDGALEDIQKWYKGKYEKSKFVEGAFEATDFFPNLGKKGKWLYFTAAIIKNASGDIVGAVETLEDITKQKIAEKALKRSVTRFSALAESAVDGIITTNINGKIMFFNDSLLNMFGYNKSELLDKPITTLMPERKHDSFWDTLEKFKKTGKHRLAGKTIETIGLRKDETEFPFEMSLAIWKSGNIKFSTSIIRDISERKKSEDNIKNSLEEKEILLKEIHHRVKNNLQIISSLLDLQEDYVKEDPTAVNVLKESQNRVLSMAMIHEMLYQSKDLNQINFSNYTRNLVSNLFHSYGTKSTITSIIKVVDVFLNIETAIPCGLVISELVSNSLKYAYPDDATGELLISLRTLNDELELIISDNGVGLPEKLDFKNIKSSLGLQLVNSLVNQLDGTIKLDRSQGTKYTITFKELKYNKRI
jgi:PAS domain S-box-containing protein